MEKPQDVQPTTFKVEPSLRVGDRGIPLSPVLLKMRLTLFIQPNLIDRNISNEYKTR
jgi:hypothetical protein